MTGNLSINKILSKVINVYIIFHINKYNLLAIIINKIIKILIKYKIIFNNTGINLTPQYKYKNIDYNNNKLNTKLENDKIKLLINPKNKDDKININLKASIFAHIKGVNSSNLVSTSKNITLITGGLGGSIKMFDIENYYKLKTSISLSNKPIMNILKVQTHCLLCNSLDKNVYLINYKLNRISLKINLQKTVSSISVDSSNSDKALLGTSIGSILEIDLKNGSILTSYNSHLGSVQSIEPLKKSRFFVSASKDNTFRMWSRGLPFQVKKIGRSFAGTVLNSHPLVYGSLIAYQCYNNKILIMNAIGVKNFRIKRTLSGHNINKISCKINSLPLSSILISGDYFGGLHYWNWCTGHFPINSFKVHKKACIDLLIHNKPTLNIFTASWDGFVNKWSCHLNIFPKD